MKMKLNVLRKMRKELSDCFISDVSLLITHLNAQNMTHTPGMIFMKSFKFILALITGSLLLVSLARASSLEDIMLHCEDQNISIHKDGLYLLIHGFGTDLGYQRYNNIDHPVLGAFDAEKQNKEKTWVFTETEALDKNYEIIYVFAINNLSLKRIVHERGDVGDFKKGSRKEPKICFPIENPF